MPTIPLSPATRARLEQLFRPEDIPAATALLEQDCGTNLPFLEKLDAIQLERWRFAALKLSEGHLPALHDAIALAKTDWRDLLVAAGFANDIHAHEHWLLPRPRS